VGTVEKRGAGNIARPSLVFMIFGGPRGHEDRSATCWPIGNRPGFARGARRLWDTYSTMAASIEVFESTLQNLIARFDGDRAHYLAKGCLEAQARADLIAPFFEALGWDLTNETGLTGENRATRRPAYSFRVAGRTRFFFEGQPPSQSAIAAQNILQAKTYAWNTGHVSFVAFFDFMEFRVYDAAIPPDERNLDEGLLLRLGYRDYLKNIDRLWNFSRDRVAAGSLGALLPQDRRSQKLRIPVERAFLDEMIGWREDLAKNIHHNNPDLTICQLNEVVERRLGRIVFFRFAEERRVHIPERLHGLFEPPPADEVKIDSDALARIVERLRPPISPYRFDVIGIELLGSIYESRFGNTIRLRKAGGIYYTPKYIVDYIVKGAVDRAIEGKTPKQIENLRILDPACGSGVFLLSAFQSLIDYHLQWYLAHPEEPGDVYTDADGSRRLSVFRKLAILKNNLFGVDIDSQAVEIARMSLYLKAFEGARQYLPPNQVLSAPLKDRIICGNALIGRLGGFLETGGFDIVIGNPPYRRELSYKDLMAEIASTPFGLKYRAPRMDLWYYFVHRGLELLKPSGVLSFIVNAYWTAGAGAGKLIAALRDTAHIDEIFSFGTLPVFPGVSGRHMVIRVAKKPGRAATTIKLAAPTSETSAEPFVLGTGAVVTFHKRASQLFRGGIIDIQPDSGGSLGILEHGTPLRELGKIRQGIAENPASINRKTNKKYEGRFKIGEGVFALRPEELRALALPRKEHAMLRPYHDLQDIGRYRLSQPSLSLIYSTPTTCPDIADYPGIRAHLFRFRPIMDARRETKKHSNCWWHLHWPRDEKLWTSPKILSLQMADRPAFVPAEEAVYVPFSVNVFIPFKSTREHLNYIAALLNSRLLWEWYRHRAKLRGAGLEINGHVLGSTPVHRIDFSDPAETASHDRIVRLVDRILALNSCTTSEKLREIRATDGEIDELVRGLYGIAGSL
jgi:adenine-specific DNA-methyltransferase